MRIEVCFEYSNKQKEFSKNTCSVLVMGCAITSLLCSPCNIISSRFSWPTWNTVNLYWPTVAANRFLKAANTYGITDATDMSWTQQAATFRNMHQFLPIHPHCLCWGFSMTYCIVVPVRKKKNHRHFQIRDLQQMTKWISLPVSACNPDSFNCSLHFSWR